MQLNLQAQPKHGIENYNILSPGKAAVWIPVIHYKGNRQFYAEARYNYEELNTGSVYAGRSFEKGRNIKYTVTPMAGIVFGQYNGVSAAANSTADYGRFNFSCQLQYTIHAKDRTENFYYNWSELSYSFWGKLYGGISLQQTLLYKNKPETTAGLLVGYSSGKVTIPVYLFSPATANRHLMTGIIIEWD